MTKSLPVVTAFKVKTFAGFVTAAARTYGYRWNLYVTALQSEFPDLHFIATTFPFNPILDPTPTEYDVHVYQSSKTWSIPLIAKLYSKMHHDTAWMSENSFYYDDFQRKGRSTSRASMSLPKTTKDPLFNILRWKETPTSSSPLLMFLFFNVTAKRTGAGAVYPSVSYYIQQLFSVYRGDEYIPSTLPARNGTVFWSVVRKTSVTPNELIIKASLPPHATAVINRNDNATDVTFQLPFNVSNTATVTVLTGAKTSANTPSNPDLVLPQTYSISTGSTFDYSAPPFSVNVLVLNIE
ncbi:hypothetical protein ARMGADRAFT_1075312 [Armillaria gallica]|uniref:Alpha-L-arabinofuranosidase C-terminal domain-containing protein n=1 Tax=Armillaria gallica TaxID=47427 RepID=A0A2H3E5P3_ARMGA|nr:hypothetical protein ARMGADRAFT_1075312 [Armillaria gallica]